MKTLKERRLWKILLALIVGIGVISCAVTITCSVVEKKQIEANTNAFAEARSAGYDLCYSICAEAGEITLDGITYRQYSRRWDSFVDGSFLADFLIRKDAGYIDETSGSKNGLVVYGRIEGYANDPDDEVSYDPGKYEIIEPYKIAQYKEPVDMWAVAGIMVIVALVEAALITALIVYFIVYAARKSRFERVHGNADRQS